MFILTTLLIYITLQPLTIVIVMTLGKVPPIRDVDEERWEVGGHRSRIIIMDQESLALMASLYDEQGTLALYARLPRIHSVEIEKVLNKLALQAHKVSDYSAEYFVTGFWDETNSQKDGTIRRETRYPTQIAEWIISGPHIMSLHRSNKTPNEGCSSNRDYSDVDLTEIPENYLPRTVD